MLGVLAISQGAAEAGIAIVVLVGISWWLRGIASNIELQTGGPPQWLHGIRALGNTVLVVICLVVVAGWMADIE